MLFEKYPLPPFFGAVATLPPVVEESIEWTDGDGLYRMIVRDSGLFIDKAITPLGFDGIEDTDWIEIHGF